MNIKNKIDDLKNKLKKWEYEYYALENPSVSDNEYDMSLKELNDLEKKHPELKTLDSPTVRVGGVISDKFNKIKHDVPMLSLSNAFNEEDIFKFHDDIKKSLSENTFFSYSIEPKIDGLSISLIYENGVFTKGITRGDGIIGEDVTNNVKTIKYIPLSIDFKEKIEVRGEIFFTKEGFKELNDSIEKPFANARNAASGSIRNLDSSITSKRNLNAIIYNIPEAMDYKIFKQSDVLKWLQSNNFNVSKNTFNCIKIQDVIEKINWFNQNKKKIPYDIDGIVIKINEINLYDEIGYTSKFPKWAIAYKFPSKVYVSKLTNITITVGRTGKINYIGNIEKINIDGTYVQNATLHNFEYINSKDIRMNDFVEVYKAGEIIPKIIGSITNKRIGNEIIFKKPIYCPSCKSILIKIEKEVDLYCLNDNCDKKKIELINHFVSRQAMNIQGLSYKIIEKLYSENIINNVFDLYSLEEKRSKIISLNLKIKDKTIDNLIKEIENSKNNSLEKLIFGLGIRHIGEVASKAIAKKYLSLENLIDSQIDSLIQISDLGEKMAKSLIEFFNNKENILLINNFIKNKIANNFLSQWSEIIIKKENEKFKNTKIVLTGSFSESRNKIKSILEEIYGVKTSSKVSPSTNFLLIGKKPTIKKIDDAKKHNIEIIETEFWK